MVLLGIAAVSLLQVRDRTTFGDEARFAAEAATVFDARGHPTAPSYQYDTPVHVRSVGVYTTTDLHGGPRTYQPGPAAHLAAWPFVSTVGVDLGIWLLALTVNSAALLSAAFAAYRRCGTGVATAVLGGGLVTAYLTTGLLTSALNVQLVVLPVFAVIFVGWGVATADVVLLPLLTAWWCFVAQTHIGYTLLPTLVVGGAGVMMMWNLRRAEGPAWRRLGRPVVVSLLIFSAAWVLPLTDQVLGTGNLLRLLTADLPSAGGEGVWRAIGALVSVPPLIGPSPDQLHGPTPIGALVAAGLGVAAYSGRRHLAAYRELVIIVALTIGGALATAAASPPSGIAYYHLYWIGITVGVVCTACAVIVVGESPWSGLATTRSTAVALGLLVVAALPVLVPQTSVRRDDAHIMRAIAALEPHVRSEVAAGGSWNITARGGYLPESVANGIAAHLQAEGERVRQGPDAADGETTLVVVSGEAQWIGSADVLSRYGSLSDEGREFERSAHAYAAEHGPITLVHPNPDTVAMYLDGRAPSVCPRDSRVDPDLLDELSPSAVAGLYAQGQVMTPLIPPAIDAHEAAWTGTVPFALLRVDEPSERGTPLLSVNSCRP